MGIWKVVSQKKTMKLTQFRKLIREEVSRVLKESNKMNAYINAVKEDYSTMSLKSNIDQKWQTADDMAGDMQQWLSSVYATGALEGYEEIMNVLQNLVDNFDPEDEM